MTVIKFLISKIVENSLSNLENNEAKQLISENNINILIDGYNLQMPNGTGIKTYTTSLIQAVQFLGLQSLVLTSLPDHSNAILSEVLLADTGFHQERSLMKQSSFLGYSKTIIQLLNHLKHLWFDTPNSYSLSRRVILKNSSMESLLLPDQLLNLEGCYETSRILHYFSRQQAKIRCKESINIWHRTYPLLPIRVKSKSSTADVITVHDLIPLKLPYLTRDRKNEYYRTLKTVLGDRPIITTISEQSRQDLLEFFDIDPDRIVVTHLPIKATPLTRISDQDRPTNDLLNPEKLDSFLNGYRLKSKQYFLFVGTLEPRKNLQLLLRAYRTLKTSMSLVIIGKRGWKSDEDLAHLEMSFGRTWYKRIKILDFVPSNELIYFYQGAFCLVFPSFYEGFGLPPIEAMSWGCPVISANNSSLPEVCGNAALYFNAHDVLDLQNAIEKLINDSLLRSQLIESGIIQAKQFSLKNFSKKLWSAYSKVL